MSTAPAQGNDPVATLTAIVQDLADLASAARPVPLSHQVRVDKEQLEALVEELREAVPHQLAEADRVLEDADRVLGEAHEQAEDVLATARARAIELVQREHVVAQAQARAGQIVAAAEAEADAIRQEADDYCDKRLAALQDTLTSASVQVAAGRRRLAERAVQRSVDAPTS
ncbi:hypothetical protein [Luteimicrobium subarcticum]|uniref:Uncharacterized protein n=1 Tax=Luteimicrobium subarcticum TaxID=620910 RepID=A0A2M8WQU5_9MICO|nr:hypothetical protein [Luteimicrobium subarcticum]PJI93264.1 hypothetical protein CLV34_1832 [Luteimicrobium subarcticum]